jgi:RimJ/RimL family protein N-acetyltransferase
MRWVGFPEGLGHDEESLRAWYEWVCADARRQHFVVRHAGVGFCGELFYAVEAAHRRAALDVKLVPEAQGRGIATAALSWLIERVFDREPEVDAVWTEPWPENRASRALYARCGLVETTRPPDLPPGPSFWERRRS